MGLDIAVDVVLWISSLIGVVLLIEGPIFFLFLWLSEKCDWPTFEESRQNMRDAVDRFKRSMADVLSPVLDTIDEKVSHIGES